MATDHNSQTQEPSNPEDTNSVGEHPVAVPENSKHWTDYVTLVFNGLVTAATVIGVLFLILQWRQTERALTEARNANDLTRSAQQSAEEDAAERQSEFEQQVAIARGNAVSAEKAANAAVSSLQEVKRNFARDQRPWAFISSFALSIEPDKEGVEFKVTCFLTNTGKSPALDLFPQSLPVFAVGELAEPPSFTTPDNPTSRMTLQPSVGLNNARMSFATSTVRASESTAKAYSSQTAKLYLYAKLSYVDSANAPHWTTVCAYHNYRDALDSWALCANGNDVDRDD